MNTFSPKFLLVPLGVGGWPLGYEERRCWANCLRNLCDHDPPISQTDKWTDGQTDDMRSQDRALHYSVLYGISNRNKMIKTILTMSISTITTKTSPAQSHLERAHWPPRGRECIVTHQLHVLAVQCPLQTSPVTQAEGSLHPYHFGPLTHQSITLTFTPTLLTILILLQPPASIQQAMDKITNYAYTLVSSGGHTYADQTTYHVATGWPCILPSIRWHMHARWIADIFKKYRACACLQCFHTVGWAAERASGL